MNFHQTTNALEAGLWAIIACGFAWQAIRSAESSTRKRCVIAASAFLVFGVSDAIEISTGAWWRPWWLLLMKAACVFTLSGLFLEYRRFKRQSQVDEST